MIGNSVYEFYRSPEWRALLKVLKNERVNERGELICAHCGKPIVKKYDCIGHHKVELTGDNYYNPLISLNQDNIVLVHHKCHNIIHNKLAHSRRNIYLVYGSPLSGKSSYVNSVKSEGDLIIDMDSVWSCLSGCGIYTKPPRLKAVVFGTRDYLLDCVKYRRGKWINAYIIGGYPLISERERLCKELGARELFISTSKVTCLKRLSNSGDRDKQLWTEYIDTWWDRYRPTLD